MPSKFIKETLLQLKPHVELHTLEMGVFNTLLSPVDWSWRQNLNRERLVANKLIKQRDLTDSYRPLQQNTKNRPSPHLIELSQTDPILYHKVVEPGPQQDL